MKKLIALLCLLSICLPLCACSSSIAPTAETATNETGAQENASSTPTKDFNVETDLPDGFCVGYARIDVTTAPLPIFEATGETAHDPLQLTVTALSDGENVALVMSLDVAAVTYSFAKSTMERVNKNFGIPKENVLLNATHTHSAHTAGAAADSSLRFTANYYKKMLVAVNEAL